MPWPRKLVRDAAYLFLPFSFVTFLILLSGALLITWGNLSNAVLVGFCVTAGLLVSGFLLCHLVLYCTTAEAPTDPEHQEGGSPTTSSSTNTPCSRPASGAASAPEPPAGSRMVCADCHGRRHEQDGLSQRDDARGYDDVNNQGAPPRRNGIPDDDELFLNLRNQVQREPLRDHRDDVPMGIQQRRASLRSGAQGPMRPPPLNVLAPARDRNGSGLRTIHLVERVRSQRGRGGGSNTMAQPPPPSWGGRALAGRAPQEERDMFPSVIQPGPAILAPPTRDQGGAIAAAAAHQGRMSAGLGHLVRRMPLHTPTPGTDLVAPGQGQSTQQQQKSTGGSKHAHQKKRPIGPRPLTVVSNSPLAPPTHDADQIGGGRGRGGPQAPIWATAQRRSNVEPRPAATTTQESHDPIKTQIRDIQQLYQGWPTPTPAGANTNDGGGTDDKSHSNNDNNKDNKNNDNQQLRSHVVLIQELDLVHLLSQGILALKPESKPPAWLLDVSSEYREGEEEEDVGKTFQNGQIRSVRAVEGKASSTSPLPSSSSSSLLLLRRSSGQRGKSQRAPIEMVRDQEAKKIPPPPNQQQQQKCRRLPGVSGRRTATGSISHCDESPEGRGVVPPWFRGVWRQRFPRSVACVSTTERNKGPGSPLSPRDHEGQDEGSSAEDSWMLVTPSRASTDSSMVRSQNPESSSDESAMREGRGQWC